MGGVYCPSPTLRKEGLYIMDYFKYVKNLDVSRSLRIYHVVQNLKGYAITIYKNLWEDALDLAFFHILSNYDEKSGGDLEHYATKVVGTIMLGKYAHEIEHDIALDEGMNKKSVEDTSANPLNILMENEDLLQVKDLKRCKRYLLPMFVQDYKFFITLRQEYRKCSYTGIFDNFSSDVILQTIRFFSKKYGNLMLGLDKLKKTCRYRSFPSDRYQKSMDPNIEYRGMLNGTLLYEVVSKRGSKFFYMFETKKVIDDLVNNFYKNEKSEAHVKVEGVDVFCSLSGKFVIGEEALRDALENEIIGSILAKLSTFRVIRYEHGVDLLLSATKESDIRFPIDIFGCTYYIEFKRVPSKRLISKSVS